METNWILKLVDQITAPMKKVTSATEGMEEAIDGVTQAVRMNERDTKQAIDNEKKHRDDVRKKIREQEKAVKELEKTVDGMAPGTAWAEEKKRLAEATAALNRYRMELEETNEDIDTLRDSLADLKNTPSNPWENTIVGVNQFLELADKVSSALDFNGEILELQSNIQRMSGATGDELDGLVNRSHHLASVYNEDGQEIARAANAWSKQMGISYDEAFDHIEAGYLKGANLNNEMLDQLKEYGPQIREAGMSSAQAMSMMIGAAQQGVMTDKAFDAIKEAGQSLREGGQAQVDALAGIGLSYGDLVGNTSFEAIQMVSKAMKGASSQARQLAMADIFRAAGEDGGFGFVEGLAEPLRNLEEYPDIKTAGDGLKGIFADAQTWITQHMGGIVAWTQQLLPLMTGVASTVTLVQSLSKATMVQEMATKAMTASQWLLNAAFKASPIGWIVTGLTVLAAGVKYAWDNFEGFRKAVFSVWEVTKTVFNNIFGLFKATFAPVIQTIGAIMDNNWALAAKAAAQINPISMTANAARYIADGGLAKGVTEAARRGQAMGAASWASDQAPRGTKGERKSLLGDGSGTILGAIPSPDSKKGGSASRSVGNGTGINGGSSGSRTINMQLEVKNYFNASKESAGEIADKVAGVIVDRLRDVAIGL